jgi:hypothetical protein
MAPLHPVPNPDRPVVANRNLDHFVLRACVALNKKFHEARSYARKTKLVFAWGIFLPKQFLQPLASLPRQPYNLLSTELPG